MDPENVVNDSFTILVIVLGEILLFHTFLEALWVYYKNKIIIYICVYIYTVNPLIVAGAFIYFAAKSPRPLL